MSSFDSLSALLRALFALWSLLLCLTNIVSGVLSLVKKRYLFSALALVALAPVFFMWQVIFDLALTYRGITALSAVSRTLVSVPWVWWLVAFIALSAAAILILGYNIRYEKNYITPSAIKSYLDEIPCGVCCWRANGRVLFGNVCMNDLCVSLTGSPLLNGNHFADAVADEIKNVDGKMWRFTKREALIRGERLYEMIASDVTTEYAKTQALEKDKAELYRINRELKEYTLSIDETVRRQEILQAKVNIHDEMNRLMLSTMVADGKDTEALDRIFSLWEQNALLLCMEAVETASKEATTRIEQLAEALKIRLLWQDALPPSMTEKQRSLFFSAAQEAIANAAKHAQASKLTISCEERETEISFRFESDGNVPAGPVRFSGGLANLARLAAEQGAAVSASSGDTFTLTVRLPAENKPNG